MCTDCCSRFTDYGAEYCDGNTSFFRAAMVIRDWVEVAGEVPSDLLRLVAEVSKLAKNAIALSDVPMNVFKFFGKCVNLTGSCSASGLLALGSAGSKIVLCVKDGLEFLGIFVEIAPETLATVKLTAGFSMVIVGVSDVCDDFSAIKENKHNIEVLKTKNTVVNKDIAANCKTKINTKWINLVKSISIIAIGMMIIISSIWSVYIHSAIFLSFATFGLVCNFIERHYKEIGNLQEKDIKNTHGVLLDKNITYVLAGS